MLVIVVRHVREVRIEPVAHVVGHCFRAVGNLTSANINRKRIHTCCSYQSNAHDIEMLFKKRDSAD